MKTRQIHLIRRPEKASTSDFVLREVELPPLRDEQVLIENLYMSVDPYMRQSMGDGKDLEPWPLNGPLNGPSVGKVIESRNGRYSVGDIVESMSGWQEHFISDADDFVPYLTHDNAIVKRRVDNGALPRDYVGLLGIASQTSYFGMICGGKPESGQTLVVSSGAGTVGSIACQIGKIKGMRVVSSAGSDGKVAWLMNDIGVDHAFNYKTSDIQTALGEACTEGIDLVLESASPEHMSACLPHMNETSTIMIAGFVSLYDGDGIIRNVSNFQYVIERFVTIRCYAFMEFLDAYDDFVTDMLSWREAGKMNLKYTEYEGLEKAPEALLSLFDGTSHGKPLVKLGN